MNDIEFYNYLTKHQNDFIKFEGKAKNVVENIPRTSKGFSGKIVFLDNGENVHPRYIAAKYPRNDQRLSSGEKARRFLRELKLQVSAYHHINVHLPFHICIILGVPVAYFRTREGDLSKYIEDTSFGYTDRISFIIQLIEGLCHCNERQLVHQDLKPENIFVWDRNESFIGLPDRRLWLYPKIADFGSVNLASEKNIYEGSYPYMAPEQWNEEPLGEWTNVFVIGIILHELISYGEHPIGEHGRGWHSGKGPEFNRWQKKEFWGNWINRKCPVVEPITNENLVEIIADCLSFCPSQRPKLVDVQQRLLNVLTPQFQIAYMDSKSDLNWARELTTPNDFEKLNEQLLSLEREIKIQYPEVP